VGRIALFARGKFFRAESRCKGEAPRYMNGKSNGRALGSPAAHATFPVRRGQRGQGDHLGTEGGRPVSLQTGNSRSVLGVGSDTRKQLPRYK